MAIVSIDWGHMRANASICCSWLTRFVFAFSIESYSCEMIGQDKRLFSGWLKAEGPHATTKDLQALSPPAVEEALIVPQNCSPSDQEMDIAHLDQSKENVSHNFISVRNRGICM